MLKSIHLTIQNPGESRPSTVTVPVHPLPQPGAVRVHRLAPGAAVTLQLDGAADAPVLLKKRGKDLWLTHKGKPLLVLQEVLDAQGEPQIALALNPQGSAALGDPANSSTHDSNKDSDAPPLAKHDAHELVADTGAVVHANGVDTLADSGSVFGSGSDSHVSPWPTALGSIDDDQPTGSLSTMSSLSALPTTPTTSGLLALSSLALAGGGGGASSPSNQAPDANTPSIQANNLAAPETPTLNATGNNQANVLVGSASANVLDGQGGDDTLSGGGGDDTLIGGEGQDTAVFKGNAADYAISYDSSSDSWTVRDLNSADGDEGTDVLRGVERLQFGSGTLALFSPVRDAQGHTLAPARLVGSSGADVLPLGSGYVAVGGQGDDVYVMRHAQDTLLEQDGQGNDTVLTYVNTPLPDHLENMSLADAGDVASPLLGTMARNDQPLVALAELADADNAAFAGGFAISQGASVVVSVNDVALSAAQLAQRFASTSANGQTLYSAKAGAFDGSERVQINASLTDSAGKTGTAALTLKPIDTTAPQAPAGLLTEVLDADTSSYAYSEFRVNTTTIGDQSGTRITALSDGGFVVTWMSSDQDGSGSGIYAQRYGADGKAQGSEFRVNTYTTYDQSSPSITVLSDGGFVVTWTSVGQDGSGSGIYAQRYGANGKAQGSEFRVNTYTTYAQEYPSITALSDGGFVVTWMSYGQDGSNSGVYAQRYGADGKAWGSEFRVNTHSISSQRFPSITALSDGGFVVTWTSVDDGSDGIYARRYAANGQAQGSEFRVNTYTYGDQSYPSITALSDGGFVVTWQSYGQDGSGTGIYAQRYGVDGKAQGSEFRVNTYTGISQSPSITALSDGGFVVTWQSVGQDGSGTGIYAQRYDAQGTRGLTATHADGFAVAEGASVLVSVNGVALSAAELAARFVTTTANGQTRYTAKANAFDGSESVVVTASMPSLADSAGNAPTTAPLTLKPIDTTAPSLATPFALGSSVTPRPTLAGSTQPGASVVLELDNDNNTANGYEVRYVTTANAAGYWSVNTALATPTSGTLTWAHGNTANAKLTVSDTAGNATVQTSANVPVLTSTYTVSNANVIEGNTGTKTLAFLVTRAGDLSAAGSVTCSVNTSNSSAKTGGAAGTANNDYSGTPTQTLSFAAGETSKLVSFTVNGDYYKESNDTLRLDLSAPANGALLKSYGTGTIQEVDVTRMQAAYSLSDVNPNLATAAIRVRRASDNTEQDIGFDAYGKLDTAAMTTFAGTGTDKKLYVTKWYDQSGNGRDMAQTNAAQQGVIMKSNGTLITRSDNSVGISFNNGENGNAGGNRSDNTVGDVMLATGVAATNWKSVMVVMKAQSTSNANGTAFNLDAGQAQGASVRLSSHYGWGNTLYWDVGSAGGSDRLSGSVVSQGVANDVVFEAHSGNAGSSGTAAQNYTDAAQTVFMDGVNTLRDSTLASSFSTRASWSLGSFGSTSGGDDYQSMTVSEFMVYLATDNSTPNIQTLRGTSDADVMTYAGESINGIDGGASFDVLYLSGAINFTPSTLANGLKNVEQIWADNGAANTITLTDTVLAGNACALVVNMGTGDTVVLNGTTYAYNANTTQTVVLGTTGDDTLSATAANDWMIGRGGSDTFRWLAGQTGTDTVADFSSTATNGKDKLDISALLKGYVNGAGLANWVTLVDNGTDTTLTVDLDGAGSGTATQAIVVKGVHPGYTVDDWVNNNLLKVL